MFGGSETPPLHKAGRLHSLVKALDWDESRAVFRLEFL